MPQAGSLTIQLYLEKQEAALAGRVTVRSYEELGPRVVTLRGVHIFAGLEMLSPAHRDAVASLREQLARLQPGLPLLNDPNRIFHRFELLRRLAQEGMNRFQVYRAADAASVRRYPVFVRHQSLHTGNPTSLIDTPAELDRALTRLRLRAHRLRDLLIVEYCHTADAEGYFRKYAAHKLGDRIVPVHLISGFEWMLKSDDDFPDVSRAREAVDHARGNLHQEWLQKVFAIAGVDYGRMDYGVLDGVPQVWEINRNPTMTWTRFEKPKKLPHSAAGTSSPGFSIGCMTTARSGRPFEPCTPGFSGASESPGSENPVLLDLLRFDGFHEIQLGVVGGGGFGPPPDQSFRGKHHPELGAALRDSTSISPSCCRSTRRRMERPNPVPLPTP